MNPTSATTTLICLFHNKGQAESTLSELAEAGIPKSSIGVMNDEDGASNPASMDRWQVPKEDRQLLLNGIQDGGVVIAVSAPQDLAEKVEDIFQNNDADQIDEKNVASKRRTEAPVNNGGTLDVIEETLNVGKQEVDRGGVRIVQRVVEKPVQQDITLRDQHVRVERKAVDRPATSADFARDQAFQMNETSEQAVISKTARVVEEVRLEKDVTDRTERIQEHLRNTDVVVENIASGSAKSTDR